MIASETPKTSVPSELQEKLAVVPRIRLGRIAAISFAMLLLQTGIILQTHLFFNLYLAASSLPQITMVLLLGLCLINRGIGRFRPNMALNGAELALIFGFLLLTAAIPQSAVCENVVSVAATPSYFSTPGNYWQGLFFGQAPTWLRVTDTQAAQSYFEGLPRGAAIPWHAWILPLAGWGIFAGLFFAAMACLAAMLYQQWAGRERLNFPLVALPLEVIRAGEGDVDPLWNNPLFWLGALVPTVCIGLGFVHTYVPTVPLDGSLERYHGEIFSWPPDGALQFQGLPWSTLNGFHFSLWAVVVGISYFLQADIAISIWAFHLLSWVERFVMASLGVDGSIDGHGDALSLIHWQEFGGCACLSIIFLANMVQTFRREGWPLRTIGLFALVNLGLIVWALAAHANISMMIGFLFISFLIVVALGRLIAGGGLFLVDSAFTPQNLLNTLAGGKSFSPVTQMTLGGMQTIYGRFDMNPAYFTLNAIRASESTGANLRVLAIFGVASVVLVYILSCGMILASSYHNGGALRFAVWPLTNNAVGQWNAVADAIKNPTAPKTMAYSWIASGALITGLLTFLQYRFVGWPLSPVGIGIATSWNTTNQIWSSVLVGWLCSAIIRRYGGLKTYNQCKPAFLGLILGNMVMVVLTSLLGALLRTLGAG